MSFFKTLKTKVLHPGKKADDNSEAIKFSTPPDQTPEKEGEKIACCENQGKNLVVATMESRFTDDMVEYALDMAQRMDYGIIAVNAANLTHDVTEFFSTSHEELFRDFKETAVKNAAPFSKRAAELGLKFAHAVKYTHVDKAIEDITKECGQIEFIITENKEPVTARDSLSNDNRIAQRLFVYSVD
ncbi:MAG: universal stress protein [Desulfobacter sp.]|nr:MAG: universal stress protein [Desulfobacter sp.]